MARIVKNFNKEISLYPIYALHDNGRLERIYAVNSIHDYNHFEYELHHYIKFQSYTKNQEWYEERGIKQKLILMRKVTHQHLENPIYSLDDDLFFEKYHIKKSELIFDKENYNRKKVIENLRTLPSLACCKNCAYIFCGVCIGDSPREMEEVEPVYRCEKWELNNNA